LYPKTIVYDVGNGFVNKTVNNEKELIKLVDLIAASHGKIILDDW